MSKSQRTMAIIVALIVVPLATKVAFERWKSRHPPVLGFQEGKAIDQGRPNWVSTRAETDVHRIEPYHLAVSASGQPVEVIADVCRELPRTRIVSQSEDYLHVEFTSKLLGFIDDVEFAYDADQKVVDFRSASRCGHSDLGVNRNRMESLRERLTREGVISPL